jgi:crotonobetainyl-CoA:carnitine CoA-transferase CaiB-like acyl-CoA transferase
MEGSPMTLSTEAGAPGPLAGIRVLEVGVWHAGPGASAILGDMGADVVKIETFGGDPERIHGVFGPVAGADAGRENWTSLFEFSNRNKRSICLDMTVPEGRKVYEELLARADVLVTNLRLPSRERIGVDYESVKAINPHVVQVSVSGFGPRGPLAKAGGFDAMGQGVGGLMYLASDEPLVMQMIVLDQLTAITAAFAAVTALFMRERDEARPGQEVLTSLYGAATWLSARNLQVAGLTNSHVSAGWVRTRNSPLRSTFRCADDGWIIGTNHPEEKYWPAFCAAIERPELEHDERFATKQLRGENSSELFAILDAVFLERTRDEWVARMVERGVLFVGVQRPLDVLGDPQATENGYVVEFEHEHLGRVRQHGFPIEFGAASAGPALRAPALGEHTDDLLRELGYDDASIARVRESAVVK